MAAHISQWIGDVLDAKQTVKDQAQKHNVSTPLIALVAVARFLYQRRQASLEQLRLDQLHIRQLTAGSDMEEENEDEHVESSSHRPFVSPITEWNFVAEDGTQALSLVFYPVEEVDDEVEKNLHADETLVLVIPGNPGNPYFYIPLMQQIVKKLGRRHDGFHSAGAAGPESLLRKATTSRKSLSAFGGHWTLDWELHPAGHCEAISSTDSQAWSPAAYNHARGAFPERETDDAAVQQLRAGGNLASLSLVNSIVLQNVFSMGASEVSDVIELDSELVFKHAEKILFVYSAVDDWVPGEFVQEYQLRFPAARHRIVPHGHAFMMEPNGTRDTMAHISQWIGDILDAA
ncbi:hypothetical protein ON010_g5358 [Phytophthora cinnamomi]|nr:hypothetical protein ON010_g5358 [Phytophthora cinnamomi]